MSQIQTQIAIENSMKQSPDIMAVLGNPIRLYDAPAKHALYPFAIWRRWESKPIGADFEGSIEYNANLEISCKLNGISEARAAIEAFQKWALNPQIQSDEVKIALVMITYCDVFRSIDGRNFYGVIRMKILSETI